jgi:hypothetical protein
MTEFVPALSLTNDMMQCLMDQDRIYEPRFFNGALLLVWSAVPHIEIPTDDKTNILNLYSAAVRHGFVDC